MRDPRDLERQARRLLMEARSPVILTGAGISAESGIRTFRDSGGLWEQHAIDDVATLQGFRRDPELVWRFYNARRRSASTASPNTAHRALAHYEQRLRRYGPSSADHGPLILLTQNIDGLHQKAGSRHVVELHGTLWGARCSECGIRTTPVPLEVPILPSCEECDGLLRPDVVWFGEPLDPERIDRALEATDACDVFLVVGTSAIVQPAAGLPYQAARRGVPVIEVNLEETPVTRYAAYSLFGKAGEILPELLSEQPS